MSADNRGTRGQAGPSAGDLRGATRAHNELAGFLRAMTAESTVRDLATRYRTGKTLWSQYRSGARIVPLHLLERVVTDRVADQRGREIALARARELHERAEAATPEPAAPRTPADTADNAQTSADNTAANADNLRWRWWPLAAACLVLVVAVAVVLWPAVTEDPSGQAAGPDAAPRVPDGLYALSADRGSVLWWNDEAGDWVTVGGPTESLTAGSAGVFGTEPASGRLYRYQGKPNAWDPIGERAAELAVDGHYLYRLSPARDLVWQWTPDTSTWKVVGASAGHLYAGSDTMYATDPVRHTIVRYNGRPGNWSQIGAANGPEDTYAVGPDRLYRRSAEDGAVWEWSNAGTWSRIGGPVRSIHAGGAGLFAIDAATGAIHRYEGDPDAWPRFGGPAVDVVVTDDEVYRLAPDRSVVSRWSARTEEWTDLAGPVAEIAATG